MLLNNPLMLITDDDRDFRETLREVFEPRGFQTLLAADGEQAVQIVRRQEIHVVLLDMHMPRLTGLETIRRVKQLRALLPCILMSAQMDETLAQAAQQAKAFSFLSKPVSFREITRIVQQAMQVTYGWTTDEHAAGW